MNDTPRRGSWNGVSEEEEIRRLLQQAGARPALPADDLARIQGAARAHWEARFGARRAGRASGRWWLGLAAAALLGAIGLVLWKGGPQTQPVAPVPVASIEILTGSVEVAEGGERPRRLTGENLGTELAAGSALSTGDGAAVGRVALRTPGGASIRVDTGSRLRLVAANLVELTSGAVYVDSGADAREGTGVAVRTAAGLFQDQGTQYEVRTEGSGANAVTRLRVREGRVALRRGGGPEFVTHAGYELMVQGQGEPVRSPSDAHDPRWGWILETAPMPAIEGVKVKAFLDWLGRETGWSIRFADSKAATVADSVVLHGSIKHLTPAQAPSVVLSSAGLDHRVSDGVMTVFVAEREGARKAR